MAINVYWACVEDEWLRSKGPVSIYKKVFSQNVIKNTETKFCPAVKDYFHNVYGLNSLYSYNLRCNFTDNTVTADMHGENFFKNHVMIRSMPDKLFSFIQRYSFFTENKSLLMSLEHPFFEQNEVTKRSIVIPGTYDIGKWFRVIDFAFHIKDDYDEFKINEDDIFYYIRFHTTEKINFVQYKFTEKLRNYHKDSELSKDNCPMKKLNFFYDIFKNKKRILTEIKENVITA